MLHFIISILGILITIFFVIGTHEFAHFMVARLLGVKVLRFSIGFGKTLFKWYDKSGTEYVIAAIPLGGYVKMLDQSEGSVEEKDLALAYNTQAFYKKFLIVAAGPAMNIVCALVLYWLIFMIGFTTVKPIIGSIAPASIAAQAGLQPKQEIIKVDNDAVSAWPGFILRLIAHAGSNDHLQLATVNPNTQAITQYTINLQHWNLDGLAPDPLASLGITPYFPQAPLIIGKIADKSPAVTAGLQLQDKILSIDNQTIKNWDELINTIISHPDETLIFKIERNKKIIEVPVAISYQRNILLEKSGYLGIGPNFIMPQDLLRKIQYGPAQAFSHAWQELYDFTYFNFLLVGKLISGKISLQSLGGPITIFDTAGDALNIGLVSFLGFLAFLSISIGVINVLPIPGLDGGHLFIQFIEFLIRRPLPIQFLSILYRLGFMLILVVLMIAFVNDLLRL
jgi:regulator of sigma E protease